MRFAGAVDLGVETPAIGLDPSDLHYTPELPPPIPSDEYLRDNHILRPESGVTMLPDGEIGPSQGPNTPIKMYDGQYMPNGSEPSGYKPGPVAAAYNRREPFPVRNDIHIPLNNIPTHPIIGPDGRDKFPGFEIRNVMPRADGSPYPADETQAQYNGTEVAGIFNPLDWFKGRNQRDIERIRTGSDEPVEGHGTQGTDLFNNIRERNRMLDQL